MECTLIRKQLASNAQEIIEVIKNAALGGDMQACKMILDRICPTLKAQAAPITIKLPYDGDLTQIAKAFIKAGAEGYISPEIAAQMVSAVGQLARISEIKEKLEPEEEGESLTHIRISIIGEDKIERDINLKPCQDEEV